MRVVYLSKKAQQIIKNLNLSGTPGNAYWQKIQRLTLITYIIITHE